MRNLAFVIPLLLLLGACAAKPILIEKGDGLVSVKLTEWVGPLGLFDRETETEFVCDETCKPKEE